MLIFSHPKKRVLFLWTLLLSMAMLCAQGVKLHVHDLDHHHQQNQQHSHTVAEVDAEHSHFSIAHLSTDTSHIDHHDELVSELDVSPDSLLQKISNSVLPLVLFSFVIILFFAVFFRPIAYLYQGNTASSPWRYLFSPPQRAPPL